MTQTCSNCLFTLDADADFCGACGNSVLKTISCPKCDKTIKADTKFCKYCAFDLSGSLVEITTQVATIPAEAQPEETKDNPTSLISPSGATFAVICFFLPWLQQSCGDSRIISTGTDIAESDSILWLLPILGIIAFAAFFICKGRKMLCKSRPFIIGTSAFALIFFIYKFYGILSEAGYFEQQNDKDIEIQILSGSYGIIIGFLLAIAGCFFISRTVATNKQSNTKHQILLDR